MAIAVEGHRQAVAAGDVAHELEVARAVLLVAEGGEDEPARGVVDGAHEREPGPATLEPVVAAAVDLEEQALAGHPLATAPVAGRPAGAWAGTPPPAGSAARTGARARCPHARRAARSGGCRWHRGRRRPWPAPPRARASPSRSPGARPTPVAVGERRRALGEEAGPEAPGLAHRDIEQLGGLLDVEVPRHQMGQDPSAPLLLGRQRDRVSHRGRLTRSLSSRRCHDH